MIFISNSRYLKSNRKSGQKYGRIKNTNIKNKTAQSTHIKRGKVINSSFDFRRNECAIKPWIPRLNSKKSRLEALIKKVFEYDSFATKRKIPNTIAIKITILNILLDILLII